LLVAWRAAARPVAAPAPPRPPEPAPRADSGTWEPSRAVSGNGHAALSKAHRTLLTVLAQHGGCTKERLTLLSRYTWNGSVRTYLSELRTAGYLEGQNGGVMAITAAGVTALGPFDRLPEGPALAG